jgi:choice-of-anchor A domain-containing protein
MKHFLSSLNLTLLLASLSFSAMVNAENTKSSHLLDFNVYVSGNYNYFKSDVEGRVGVAGNAKIGAFELNRRDLNNPIALAVGGNLIFLEGSIFGGVEAGGSITLEKTLVKGNVIAEDNLSLTGTTLEGDPEYGLDFSSRHSKYNGVNAESIDTYNRREDVPELHIDHKAIAKELDSLSKSLSSLESNEVAVVDNRTTQITATHQVSVVNIDSASISAQKIVNINAKDVEKLVINVKGDQLRMQELEVNIQGVKPRQIFWNMPEATKIDISNSVNKEYGIPGIIISPNADVNFNEGLVTGGIYSKSLTGGNCNRNGGQVNLGI